MPTDATTPVLTNAEWLRLTGELSDLDLLQLERGAHDTVSAVALSQLADLVYDRHTDEVCTHCTTHLAPRESQTAGAPATQHARADGAATLLSIGCPRPVLSLMTLKNRLKDARWLV